jgi:hypothetical protein
MAKTRHLRVEVIELPSQDSDRTAQANALLTRKFLDEAGGDQVEADRLRREYYRRLQLRSVAKRRAKAAARAAAALRAQESEYGQTFMSETDLLRFL